MIDLKDMAADVRKARREIEEARGVFERHFAALELQPLKEAAEAATERRRDLSNRGRDDKATREEYHSAFQAEEEAWAKLAEALAKHGVEVTA